MNERPRPPAPPQAQDGFGLGVAGIYHGGVKWAVKQNLDLIAGGQPIICDMDNEAIARQFHKSWGDFAKEKLPDNPECWPELVAARITWQVQE